MAEKTRTDERRAAWRVGLAAIGWLLALFAWAALLSFDPADPPSASVWPLNAAPANLCGAIGATVAWHSYYYLGMGAFALLLVATAGLAAWSRGGSLPDLWLRAIGAALIVAVAACFAASFVSPSERWTPMGAGGVLGTVLSGLLMARLQGFGTLCVLALGLVVGMILAADVLFLGLFRSAHWLGRRSGVALARGGAAVASAGAAVATGVAQASQRISAPQSPAPKNGKAEPPRPTRFEPAQGELALAAQRRPSRGKPADEEESGAPPHDERGADRAGAPKETAPAARKPADDEPRSAPGKREAEDDEDPESENAAAAAKPAPPRAAAPPAEQRPAGLVVRDVSASARPSAPPPGPKKPAPLFPSSPADEKYELPPLPLLDAATPIDRSAIESVCREKAHVLAQTLNEFRLEVQVVAIETGPVITVFELRLAPGIKVSQIASLTNDIARALKAPAVRVVAPLPGKNTIGIEVPNTDKEKVRLRDVIENSASRTHDYALPLYLGKDAAGQPLVADLTRMPHLLIAGTTGSGKSVCVTSIIMSFLLTRTPAEVNLILVDPKVVELAMYKDVPHLMCPIITEMAKAEQILDWATTKMDERYELLAEAGVKDIRSYNRLGRELLKERLSATDEEMAKVPVHLPYIVIVIDELADLMMTSAKEVEFYLARLAQKSRAVGIHLIVSTQRPQANVVTGLIKSNLPSRIAFRVASRLDSRIVLDQNGGEVLMGQGDMLFLPPGQSKLVRSQGTFISDEELRSVVSFCKQQRGPQYHPELVRMPGKGGESGGERDELFDQAVEIIIESGRGSVSLLQRRLTIGYGRASRLIDQMYGAGIIGEYKGSQAREVMLTLDEWRAIRSQRDTEEAAEAEVSTDASESRSE